LRLSGLRLRRLKNAARRRMRRAAVVAFGLLLAMVFMAAGFTPPGRAQNRDSLMPEASTAKAKKLLDQLITALGGPTYLDIRDSHCEGRLARFGHNGEMSGYTPFKDYWLYPDTNRTDYSKKGVIINLYSGDKGWTLDKGGVSELSAASIEYFQEQAKKDINNLLRNRVKEPGMQIRFGGTDVVDLKTVDWVDITDPEQRNFRLAIDRSTHLLVRAVVSTPDENTHDRSVETSIYANFQLMDGVRTPLQITTDRDGRRVAQVFFNFCRYNSLSPDLFTKAALEKRFSEVGGKKYKEEKKKEKEED